MRFKTQEMLAILVTQEHIDNGVPVSPHHCPLALAIIDANAADRVSVGTATATLYRRSFFGERAVHYNLSGDARAFVRAVDGDCGDNTPKPQPQIVHLTTKG